MIYQVKTLTPTQVGQGIVIRETKGNTQMEHLNHTNQLNKTYQGKGTKANTRTRKQERNWITHKR